MQLLARFRKAVVADEPNLNFDYIGFTVDCASLLTEVSRSVGNLNEWEEDERAGHVELVTRLLATADIDAAVTSASTLR